MIFTETKLKGAFIIDVTKLEDPRGFFGRSWCQKEFEEHGLVARIAQANLSYNHRKGTLRGMHFQRRPYAETKLIRCTRGAIVDVLVDLRPGSPTFKQWIGVELTADNYRMLFVPEDFANGYQTLADGSEVTYQVSQFYTPGAEGGLRWNDPAIGIQWPLPVELISDKDRNWPDFGA